MPRVRVCVVADDLGICAERDRGIFQCLDHGIVTSAVVLPNGETSAAACAEARRRGHDTAHIGLHLNVSEGPPLCDPASVPTLLRQVPPLAQPGSAASLSPSSGPAPRLTADFAGMRELQRRFAAGRLAPAELARECRAQLEWFRVQFGRFPAFVNGHQHCHILLCSSEVAAVLRDCGVRYLRCTEERLGPAAVTAHAPPPLCERCAWVSEHSTPAMDMYRAALPTLRCNDAFVGLSFCKRVYTAGEWAAAVASAAARAATDRLLSQRAGEEPAGNSGSDHGGEDSAALDVGGGGKEDDGFADVIVEAMVHPGYAGIGWDDFNASAEREVELAAMTSPREPLLRRLREAVVAAVAATAAAGGGVAGDWDVCFGPPVDTQLDRIEGGRAAGALEVAGVVAAALAAAPVPIGLPAATEMGAAEGGHS